MAIVTIAAQLEEVQTAITAVLAGQSFTIDGVTYTRPKMADLVELQEKLKKQYAKSADGGRKQIKTANFAGMGYD